MLCRLEDAIFIFYNLVTIPRIRQVDTKTPNKEVHHALYRRRPWNIRSKTSVNG